MTLSKSLVLASVALAAASASAPAFAVVQTFATYAQSNGQKTFRWVNGTGTSNTATANIGGRVFSTVTGANAGSLNPGTTIAQFSSLQSPLSNTVFNLQGVKFTLLGSTTQATVLSGANVAGTNISQGGINGSFSYIAATPLILNCNAPCTNLLTGTFTNAKITSSIGATTLSLQINSTSGGTLVYTSDFLDFSQTITRDASFAVSGLSNTIRVATGKSLRSTRGFGSGNFSSDPAPVVNGVPEPQVWLMMVAGFGLVGISVRRRSRIAAIVA